MLSISAIAQRRRIRPDTTSSAPARTCEGVERNHLGLRSGDTDPRTQITTVLHNPNSKNLAARILGKAYIETRFKVLYFYTLNDTSEALLCKTGEGTWLQIWKTN